MNQFNFNQVGGLPMTTRILDELQKAFAVFNGLGALSGDMTIISGCVTTGSNVSDGVVFVNGEVFEFKGGTVQTKVKIVENAESLMFQDGASKPVIKTRYVTFGTGIGAMDWVGFSRPFEMKLISTSLVLKEDKTTTAALAARVLALEARPSNIPIGLIAIWDKSLSEIPIGWSEYVDLRGRMPIGHNPDDSDFSSLRGQGGSKKKTLSIAELPSHFFTYLKAVSGRGYKAASDDNPLGSLVSAQTNTIGNNQAFDVMNPYRIVHFIKYTG